MANISRKSGTTFCITLTTTIQDNQTVFLYKSLQGSTPKINFRCTTRVSGKQSISIYVKFHCIVQNRSSMINSTI